MSSPQSQSNPNSNPELPISGDGVSSLPSVLLQLKGQYEEVEATFGKVVAAITVGDVFPSWLANSVHWMPVQVREAVLFVPHPSLSDATVKANWVELNNALRKNHINIELIADAGHGVWLTEFKHLGVRYVILTREKCEGFEIPVTHVD